MEKYLSLSVGQLRFIDSFQFLNATLDSLVNNLKVDDLKYTSQEFPNLEKFDLVRRKAVFPYDFLDLMERFDDVELHSRQNFLINILVQNVLLKIIFVLV